MDKLLKIPQEIREMIYYNLSPKTVVNLIFTNTNIKDTIPIYIKDEISYGVRLMMKMNKINPVIRYNKEYGNLQFSDIGTTIVWEDGLSHFKKTPDRQLDTIVYPRDDITLYSTTNDTLYDIDIDYIDTDHLYHTFVSKGGFTIRNLLDVIAELETEIYRDKIDSYEQSLYRYDINNIIYYPRFEGISWSPFYGVYEIQWSNENL